MYGVILHYACLGTISPLIPVAFVGFEDSLLELLGLFLNIKIRLVRGRLVGVSLGVCRLHLVWCGRVGPVAECALYIRGLSAPADSGFIGISGAQTHLYLLGCISFPFWAFDPSRQRQSWMVPGSSFLVVLGNSGKTLIKCRLKGEG